MVDFPDADPVIMVCSEDFVGADGGLSDSENDVGVWRGPYTEFAVGCAAVEVVSGKCEGEYGG